MATLVKKVNKKLLREACQRRGIKSFSALAVELGCARNNIYEALERPHRMKRLYSKIQRFCE